MVVEFHKNICYVCIEQVVASDLDTDPFLGLQDDEPETWTPTVKKEVC